MEMILGIRIEFVLFALTLLGVALLHKHTFWVGLCGLSLVLLFKMTLPDFHPGEHFAHEAPTLLNLLGLLLGFAILAKYFEESGVPQKLPVLLPGGWKGGFVLLLMVAALSSFLDNIAAAMIGGMIARFVFKGKVHVGYVAAIVAASNAGGSGSVVGDTTTTMMWIDGIAAGGVLPAYIAAIPAVVVCGLVASRQQDKWQPLDASELSDKEIDFKKLIVVVMILAGAIITNITLDFPAAGVWAAIAIGSLFSRVSFHELPSALKGSVFLLSLVSAASLMPVDELPTASWHTAGALGFISAVFDNIPLTKLALEQGGYDWAMLAYSVGFGGSMIWFGSSAGVAITNLFPEAASVGSWLKNGWHVMMAYVIAFLLMLVIWGWQPF
ncbi:MAG: citrate transporter [Flavobacteriales bacterium]|nr:hypothetical protein [Flavobacteriales bacterium]MCB9448468.1 citrate transporter [Flavobacteriales bacterium]